MKRILVNLCCAQPSVNAKFHGGGEYTKSVFEYLANNYHGNAIELTAIYYENRFIDSWIIDQAKEKGIQLLAVNDEHHFEKEIDVSKYDLYFSGIPYNLPKFNVQKQIKTIATMHDLRDYEEPVDSFSYLYYDDAFSKVKQLLKCVFVKRLKKKYFERYKACISSFDETVCVSNHTYHMVKTVFPDLSHKVKGVFYTPSKHYCSPKKPKDFDESGFLLIVSANRWLKNAYRAIRAIDGLYSKGALDRKTVIVGTVSKSIFAKITNKEKFVILEYLESEELEYLYQQCGCLVYPTLNEGFGMPPLEAMRHGKTCVMSGICSLPELYGGAAYFFNPYNQDEIGARILEACDHPIPCDVILNRFNTIHDKQDKDLAGLCKFIVDRAPTDVSEK